MSDQPKLAKRPAALKFRVSVERTDEPRDADDVFSRVAETAEQAEADTVAMCELEGWTVNVLSVVEVDAF
jgi:hypothetical protein